MKKTLYILSMAVAMMFASCQKENLVSGGSDGDGAVAFSAESIASLTKVSGSEWQKDDAIGITAITTSNSNVVYDNIKYLATEDGEKVSFNPDSEIIYNPDNGESTYYVAYYPYQKSWSYEAEDMIIDLSEQDGTLETQSKLDFLKSVASSPEVDKPVVFQFTHALSKVQITVSNYDELSIFENLDALTAILCTKNTQYNMLKSEIIYSNTTKELEMVGISNNGNTVIFTAIIAPGEVSDEIILSDGNRSYSATLSISSAIAGKQYNYTATVGDQGLAILKPTSDNVTDWEAQENSIINRTDIEIVNGIYQIYTTTGLKTFANIVNGGNPSIDGRLMNNINLNGSDDNQWTPIGTSENYYSGNFDGGNFEISGLHINNALSNKALFGYTFNSTISNLGVDGNIRGYSIIGGVVALAYNTTISNCYFKGSVYGSGEYIGGLIGKCLNTFHIINSYNSAKVEGSDRTGGIIGNLSIGDIINSYNRGEVISTLNYAGGIAGCNFGKVNNCYNTAQISGKYAGAVAGSNSAIASITSCYYDSTYMGDGVGDDSGLSEVTGYTTDYMQSANFIIHLNNAAYTYNQTNPDIKAYAWKLCENGYPILDTDDNNPAYTQIDIAYDTENETYQIYTADGMRTFADLVNGSEQSVSDLIYDGDKSKLNFGTVNNKINGSLMADIDLGGSANPWTPIGGELNQYEGVFNGGGHTISSLYINSNNYLGLFGYTNNTTIYDLGIKGTVSGVMYVGGLIGKANNTEIYSCYSSVPTSVTSSYVGGIVGYLTGTSSIKNCYNTTTVVGNSCRGGLVGCIEGIANISYCYNSGSVSEATAYNGNCGYLVGLVSSGSLSINHCRYYYTSYGMYFDYKGGNSKNVTNVDVVDGKIYTATQLNDFQEENPWADDSNNINGGNAILIWQSSNND